MKIRNAIILILWVASLGAPLLSLHASECEEACCVATENTCPMEEHGDKCPGMQAGTPIHPIPAAPINTYKDTVILAKPAALQMILVELQPDHLTIRPQSNPPLILPLATPLLI